MTLIFHASDLHFGTEDRAALDWFAARVAAERPDAIIITGDLTMRARHREFHAARQWMASLGTPIHVEMGNHDMPYFNPVERIWRPYQRYQRMAASLDAPLMVDGVAVVVVGSAGFTPGAVPAAGTVILVPRTWVSPRCMSFTAT